LLVRIEFDLLFPVLHPPARRDDWRQSATPNPDKQEKWPQKLKNTKQNGLLKFIFVFWCLSGENIFPKNAQK